MEKEQQQKIHNKHQKMKRFFLYSFISF
jgi:hypothetical protein